MARFGLWPRFLLARCGSIFGFHLTFTSTEAYTLLVVEGGGDHPARDHRLAPVAPPINP